MYCKSCGVEIPDDDEQIEYCTICVVEMPYLEAAEAWHYYCVDRAEALMQQFDEIMALFTDALSKDGSSDPQQ
jgi:hypothetical protein